MREAFFRLALLGFLATAAASPGFCAGAEERLIQVGSKKFTESVVLGEIATQAFRSTGHPARHRSELGGTRILWNSLLNGDIDAYPEYTGTLTQELLQTGRDTSLSELRERLAKLGLRMTDPLGFNNTYAIGMRKERARELGIRTISDLAKRPALKFGFSNEFRERADGWPLLRSRYSLPHRDVRGLDHDVAYRALQTGDIDVIDLYSTDAEIQYYDLAILEDDLGLFPRYDALFLYRNDLAERAPEAVELLRKLEGRIPEATMVAMNARAKLERTPEPEVANQYLEDELKITSQLKAQSTSGKILGRLAEHLSLVAKSLLAALLFAIPLGVLAAKRRWAGQGILTAVGIIQTIPALALLVMLIQPLKSIGLSGIGDTPAMVALFLYSLLPMVRSTHAGMTGISPQLLESAEALGLSPWQKLRLIELPLASPHILSGIKTAAVINVGFATLGALVGAGGFGQPILTGIRLDDASLILQGALPAALLALAIQFLFDFLERFLVPHGIRL